MKFAGILLLGALALPLGAGTATNTAPPVPPVDLAGAHRVTPQLLLAALRPTSAQRKGGAWLPAFHQARGYLRAMKDTAPSGWCAPATTPDEVDGEILAYFAQLPPASQEADAAGAVAAALRTKFPCRR